MIPIIYSPLVPKETPGLVVEVMRCVHVMRPVAFIIQGRAVVSDQWREHFEKHPGFMETEFNVRRPNYYVPVWTMGKKWKSVFPVCLPKNVR